MQEVVTDAEIESLIGAGGDARQVMAREGAEVQEVVRMPPDAEIESLVAAGGNVRKAMGRGGAEESEEAEVQEVMPEPSALESSGEAGGSEGGEDNVTQYACDEEEARAMEESGQREEEQVVGSAAEARAREEKLNMSLMQSMSRETLMIREVQLLQEELNEAAGWEAEVHRLREMVEELERGKEEAAAAAATTEEEVYRLRDVVEELERGKGVAAAALTEATGWEAEVYRLRVAVEGLECGREDMMVAAAAAEEEVYRLRGVAAAALREATEWEAEVYRLRGVVEELERGRLEEDEEFSRLAKALTEMQDGIQEERREREWKEEEWERERASMSAQVSSVKGVLLVELQVASSKDNSG